MTMISSEHQATALAYAQSLVGGAASGGGIAGSGFQSLLDTGTGDQRTDAIIGALAASVATPATAVNAQAIGQSDASKGSGAREEFLKFMDMDPQARMRAQMLGGMGLTEEELAAMPPEERKKIEDRIRELIAAKVQEDTEEKVAEAANAAAQAQSAPVAASVAAGIATTADGADEPATGAGLFPAVRRDPEA